MTVSAVVTLIMALTLAPLLPGVANRTKALLTGRRGAPVTQLYYDLAKLWRKGAVYSRTTTVLFRLGPVVFLVATVLAASLLPLDGRGSVVTFQGDLVAFAGLLALGRFMMVLAALDTGSSFEGMGASREVTVATFAEPSLFLCFAVFVLATGNLTLTGSVGPGLDAAWSTAAPSLLLAAGSLFIVTLAESCRVPVDDPATHLELTMIHEVMVLDHSGPDLALILYGTAVKLALFGALIVNILIPRSTLGPVVGPAGLAAGLLGVAVAIGVVESVMARLKMNRVPQLLIGASALATFALILQLR
jgi:formate hydrogenlyase subunit 4